MSKLSAWSKEKSSSMSKKDDALVPTILGPVSETFVEAPDYRMYRVIKRPTLQLKETESNEKDFISELAF